MKEGQILRGNFGSVYVDNEKMARVKNFESKVTGEYKDLDVCGVKGKVRILVGYEGEGTLVLLKTNQTTKLVKKILQGFQELNPLDISIIANLNDPLGEFESVEYIGVTFDETELMKFEPKEVIEFELPFKFEEFKLK